MSVIFLKRPDAGSLGPAELAVATEAFESALNLIGAAGAVDGVRETLADDVMRMVLSGARDALLVRDAAIRALTGVQERRIA
jgi:hypothetical protein